MGRWNKKDYDSKYVSNWPGAFVRTRFNGSSLVLRCDNTEQTNFLNIQVSIDDNDYKVYHGEKCPLILADDLDWKVDHMVQIVSEDGSQIHFESFWLDEEATTLPPKENAKEIIEFIGDSVTMGAETSKTALTSYGWLTAENLNMDPVIIAQAGICLLSGERALFDTNVGMEDQIWKSGPYGIPDGFRPWNIEEFVPSIIVLNIGTNDFFANDKQGVSSTKFVEHYVRLLGNLRYYHPLAEILVLRPFQGHMEDLVYEAVQSRQRSRDVRLHYVDTNDWIPLNEYFDFLGTKLHPTDHGQKIASDHLTEIIRPLRRTLHVPPPSNPPLFDTQKNFVWDNFSWQKHVRSTSYSQG